jgi:RNA polymerase sigma-70 factor (ECF subfamily)
MNDRRRQADNPDNEEQQTRSSRWTVLLVRARRGDRGAFDTLMEEAETSVFLYVLQSVGDATLAEDIVTETFEKVWLNLDSYNEELSNARTWVYLIANRIARDYLDKRRRQRRREAAALDTLSQGSAEEGDGPTTLEPEDQAEAAPHEGADRPYFRALVEEALAELSEADSAILRLCHVEELSYEEIAARLGCSIKAVGPRLTRARERFRQALDSHAQP